MVVHGHAERPLGPPLADDVLVEKLGDLARRGHRGDVGRQRPRAAALLLNDRLAEIDALDDSARLTNGKHSGMSYEDGVIAAFEWLTDPEINAEDIVG